MYKTPNAELNAAMGSISPPAVEISVTANGKRLALDVIRATLTAAVGCFPSFSVGNVIPATIALQVSGSAVLNVGEALSVVWRKAETSEEYPLFSGILDGCTSSQGTLTINAYDALYRASALYDAPAAVLLPCTAADVISDIAGKLGVDVDSATLTAARKVSLSEGIANLGDEYSMAQALGAVAAVMGGNVVIARNGKLRVKTVEVTGWTAEAMAGADQPDTTPFAVTGLKLLRKYTTETEDPIPVETVEEFAAGSPIVLMQDNPLATSALAQNAMTALSAVPAFHPARYTIAGGMMLEPGDAFEVLTVSGSYTAYAAQVSHVIDGGCTTAVEGWGAAQDGGTVSPTQAALNTLAADLAHFERLTASYAKISKADIDELKVGAATIEGTVNGLKSTVKSAQDTADSAKAAINNLAVGGRNLLLGSREERTGHQDAPNWTAYPIAQEAVPLEQAVYTISFDAKSSNGTDKMYIGYAVGESTKQRFVSGLIPTAEFKHYTYTAPNGRTDTNSIIWSSYHGYGGNDGNTGIITVRNVKLEKGNIATDWTPAPEDTEIAVARVTERVATVEQTAEGLKTRVTATETVANSAKTAAATAQSTANSAKNAIDSLEGVVDTKADASAVERVTERVATVEQTAEGLKTRVSATETVANNAKTAAATAQATADSAHTAIGNLGDVVDGKADSSVVERVTERVATVEQTADGLKTRVSATETVANNAKTAAATAQATADSAHTAIGNLGDVVDGKADSSVVERVTERVATVEQTADGLKTRVTATETVANSAKEAIDGLEVGGRNLLLDSREERTGHQDAPNWTTYPIVQEAVPLEQVVYTISFEAKSSNGTDKMYIGYAIGGSTKQRFVSGLVPTSDFKRYTYTAPNAQSGINCVIWSSYNRHQGNAGNTGIITVRNVKLEKGTIATDWTPAPEDVEDRISKAESSITQNASNIALKVSKEDYTGEKVASMINLTPDTVQISGKKVNIAGNVLFQATQETADSAKAAIDNLTVGGRNLLLGSGDERTGTQDRPNWERYDIAQEAVPLEQAVYTISFDAKSSNGTDKMYIGYAQRDHTNQRFVSDLIPTAEFRRYTYTAPNGRTDTNSIVWSSYHGYDGNDGNTGVITVRNVKLEKGNIPTDWTPAPEDTESAITAALETAKSKSAVYRQSAAPTGADVQDGDVWFDTPEHGGGIYNRVNGQWIAHEVGTVSIADGAVTADKMVVDEAVADAVFANSIHASNLDIGVDPGDSVGTTYSISTSESGYIELTTGLKNAPDSFSSIGIGNDTVSISAGDKIEITKRGIGRLGHGLTLDGSGLKRTDGGKSYPIPIIQHGKLDVDVVPNLGHKVFVSFSIKFPTGCVPTVVAVPATSLPDGCKVYASNISGAGFDVYGTWETIATESVTIPIHWAAFG